MITRDHLFGLFGVLSLVACGEQVGLPQPEPLPLISSLRHSGSVKSQVQQTYLLGLPGACDGAGPVLVTGSQGTFQAMATTVGSFLLTLRAQGGETVEVRYNNSLPTRYTLTPVYCPVPPCSPSAAPHQRSGVTPITAPLAGNTTIRGESAAGAKVIAANEQLGQVATATTAADGAFEVTIAAFSGNLVQVFQDGDPLSSNWTLTVP